MPDDLERSLATVAKGAGIVFFGMIIGNLLGLLNQIILGRFLGVEIYGIFNLALSLATMAATLAIFGLLGGLPRFIPFHLKKGEKGIVKSTIRFSLGFVLCTSIIIGVILYIFSGKISVDIFHEENLHIGLKYFFLGLPLIVLPQIFLAIIRGFKAVKYKVFIFDVGIRMVKLIVFVLLIVMGYKLFGAIAAYFTAMIVAIIVSIFVIRKKLFPDHHTYDKVAVGKKLLLFSWPLALTGMTFLFVSKTDVILLGYYLTPKDIGIYAAALVIVQFMTFIGASFGYIFLPVVSELFAKEKLSYIESLFKSTSKWIFIMVLPMFLYLLIFPQEIITLLYGFEYSKGYIALVILAFGISMNLFTGITGGILVGGGFTKLNLAVEVIAAITNISLNIVLIPKYGIIGAAIGTSASYFTRNVASLVFVYKTTKMHPYTKDYLKIIAVGIVAFVIIYLTKFNIESFFYWPILMVILGFLLLFLYVMLLLPMHCLDKNDIFIFRMLEGKLGFKFKFLFNFLRKFI